MTTTAGLPTVAAALAETVDVARDLRARPARRATTAGAVDPGLRGRPCGRGHGGCWPGSLLPAWSPTELLLARRDLAASSSPCAAATPPSADPPTPSDRRPCSVPPHWPHWWRGARSRSRRPCCPAPLARPPGQSSWSWCWRRCSRSSSVAAASCWPGPRSAAWCWSATPPASTTCCTRLAGRPGSGRTDVLPVAVCVHGQEPLDLADLADASEHLTVWLGTDDLLEVVRAHSADAVIVATGSDISHAELRRWGCWLQDEGTELLVSSGLRDVAPSRIGLSALGGLQLLRVRPAAITGATHLLKNLADRAAAAFLLALLAPVLIVTRVADPPRLPRPGDVPPDPGRAARPAVHGLQAAHHAPGRRHGRPRACRRRTSRTATASCSRSGRTRASPGSAPCCASTPSTSCRS